MNNNNDMKHGLNIGEQVAFFGEHGWVVGFTSTGVKVDFGDGPVEIHADKPLWIMRTPISQDGDTLTISDKD